MSHLVVRSATEVDPEKKNSKYAFIFPHVQSTYPEVLVAIKHYFIIGEFQ